MPAMCLRFWPEWKWVKDAIDEDRYGRPLSARFRRVAEAPAWGQNSFLDGEKSGGGLLDLHIHDAILPPSVSVAPRTSTHRATPRSAARLTMSSRNTPYPAVPPCPPKAVGPWPRVWF